MMNLIVQFFLPVPVQDELFNRLVRVRILQGYQASYPALHVILGLDPEKEIAWKKRMDSVLWIEQRKEAVSICRTFLSHPNTVLIHPFFPSKAFNQQPCMTYIHDHLEKSPYSRAMGPNALMRRWQVLEESLPQDLNPEVEKPPLPSSLLCGTVAVGIMGYSLGKAMHELTLPVMSLLFPIFIADMQWQELETSMAFLAITLAAGTITVLVQGQNIDLLPIKLPSKVRLIAVPVFVCAALYKNFQSTESLWTSLTSKELLLFAASVIPINVFLPLTFFRQTKASLREMGRMASISVRNRVGLAQLLLIASKARRTEN